MGQDSQKREATDDEIKQMSEIVETAMQQGALGVSSSYVDVDENLDPVPSRFSCKKEKIALAKAATKTGKENTSDHPSNVLVSRRSSRRVKEDFRNMESDESRVRI